MQAHKALWERLCAELNTLSPLSVLKKGYTVCWAADGRTLVRRVEDVRVGDDMTVSFHRGEFRCRVSDVDGTKTVQDRYRKAGAPGVRDPIPEDRKDGERKGR
jgi:exodeoxyribonuclease VII large subunit